MSEMSVHYNLVSQTSKHRAGVSPEDSKTLVTAHEELLTDNIPNGRFVKINTNNILELCGIDDNPFGVSRYQNPYDKPLASSDKFKRNVQLEGIITIEVSGSLNTYKTGSRIGVGAEGKGIIATEQSVGIAIEDAYLDDNGVQVCPILYRVSSYIPAVVKSQLNKTTTVESKGDK